MSRSRATRRERRSGVGLTERFIVWGAGGHARVVADVIESSGNAVAAFVDRRPRDQIPDLDLVVRLIDQSVFEGENLAHAVLPDSCTAVALGIGDNRRRRQALAAVGALPMPAVVHPSAVVSRSASVGRAVVVCPLAVINAQAVIGDGAIVNSSAVIEHDCVLGAASHISPGAVLTGAVTVGSCAWIGAGAVVLPGRRIGEAAIVGAGAVVTRDVGAGTTVVGNPARILHARELLGDT
jgi:sugar O-acyltransferase (sialic acid O-acetyltransferase NeuD family)